MTERFRLEEIAPSMKWGFLADNFLRLLKDPRPDLSADERAILAGAIEFIRTALEGAENFGRSKYEQGRIGRIVESLTLYGYATQAFPNLSVEDKEGITRKLRELLTACEDWERGKPPQEIGPLEAFFRGIARITLREADSALSPIRRLPPT